MGDIEPLFLAMCSRPDDAELQRRGGQILSSFVESVATSVEFFMGIIVGGAHGDVADFGCVSMIKHWYNLYGQTTDVAYRGKLLEGLAPILFSDRRVGSSLFGVFEKHGGRPEFCGIWSSIAERAAECVTREGSVRERLRALEIMRLFMRTLFRVSGKNVGDWTPVVKCLNLASMFLQIEMTWDAESIELVFAATRLMICVFNGCMDNCMNDVLLPAFNSFRHFVCVVFGNVPTPTQPRYVEIMQVMGRFVNNTVILFCDCDMINEWIATLFPLIWNAACLVFQQDEEISTRMKIAEMIGGLDCRPFPGLLSVPNFLPMLCRFVEIPQEDKTDFFDNPLQFYSSNYAAYSRPASLRTTAVSIVISMTRGFSQEDYARFIGMLDGSESSTMLVASISGSILKQKTKELEPISDPAWCALWTYLQRVMESWKGSRDLMALATPFLLIGKLVPIFVAFAREQIPSLVRWSTNVLEQRANAILMTFATKNLKSLYRVGVAIPLKIVIPLVYAIPYSASGSIFSFLMSLCDNNVGLYDSLTSVIPSVIRALRLELGDEEERESSDDTIWILHRGLRFLKHAIRHTGDATVSRDIFELVTAWYHLGFDFEDTLTGIAKVAVLRGSQFSQGYMEYFLCILERRECIVYGVGNVCAIFLHAMVNAPVFYVESGICGRIFSALCNRVPNYYECANHLPYGAAMILCWSLHLMPQAVDVGNIVHVMNFLGERKPRVSDFSSWVDNLVYFDLMASVSLVNPASISAEQLAAWLEFMGGKKLACKMEVNMHMTALSGLVEVIPAASAAISGVLGELRCDPMSWLEDRFQSALFTKMSTCLPISPRFGPKS